MMIDEINETQMVQTPSESLEESHEKLNESIDIQELTLIPKKPTNPHLNQVLSPRPLYKFTPLEEEMQLQVNEKELKSANHQPEIEEQKSFEIEVKKDDQ